MAGTVAARCDLPGTFFYCFGGNDNEDTAATATTTRHTEVGVPAAAAPVGRCTSIVV